MDGLCFGSCNNYLPWSKVWFQIYEDTGICYNENFVRACLDPFGMANGKSFGGKSFGIAKVLVGV